MSKYNFDTLVDRRGSNCLKYDFAFERGMPTDVLPLWVADMDFKTSEPVLNALHKAIEHGIFGYNEVKSSYFNAIKNWYKKFFDFTLKEEWLIKTPGVVFALAMAVKAFSKEGEGILIQEPVYYPFREVIEVNKRKVINNELILKDGKYEIDFEDFENLIINNDVKVFLLCNPHNPIGRAWSYEELTKMGEICLKYNVMVVSDEIHCDFVHSNKKHNIFISLRPEFEEIAIMCTAPSKTFNLAGLQISNIFIPNKINRKKFKKEINASGYSQLNSLGLIACQAAYENGDEWLLELKKYLSDNLNFLRNYLKEHLSKIHLIEPEATYLVWLDMRELGKPDEINDKIVYKAKLWLDRGEMFGASGAGFQRINIACPRATLNEALERLKKALD